MVLSAHCPDLFSPKVIRSTMGSGWRQKTVRVDDLAGSIAAWQKQGLRCYAATLSPEALPLQRLPRPLDMHRLFEAVAAALAGRRAD